MKCRSRCLFLPFFCRSRSTAVAQALAASCVQLCPSLFNLSRGLLLSVVGRAKVIAQRLPKALAPRIRKTRTYSCRFIYLSLKGRRLSSAVLTRLLSSIACWGHLAQPAAPAPEVSTATQDKARPVPYVCFSSSPQLLEAIWFLWGGGSRSPFPLPAEAGGSKEPAPPLRSLRVC